jgi:beta-lactamase superfamily II metal-dependent hydrolase
MSPAKKAPAKKGAAKKAPAKKAATGSNKVRIRMYDVGFGDGFVLFFPSPGGLRTMLLDCGSIKGGALGPIAKVADRIVADIVAETGKRRIDVVVATHRHKDHVSGFASDVWSDVEIGEVWLPWTEDPRDPVATRIREKQASLAAALVALGEQPGVVSPTTVDLALNALSNDKAMGTLHRGFKSRDLDEPRYLPEKDRDKATFKSTHLPGVLVRVLGPSRTESVIQDMDPPAGESYLAAARLAESDGSSEEAPFATRLNRADYLRKFGRALEPVIESRLRSAGTLDDMDLAATLESAVNGTSLMLMLDVGKARLLLPGDAQWGTWQAALEDPEWKPLFKGADFYKVGHHGSHNATPMRFVEHHLKDGVSAKASVTPIAKWKNIPRAPLLTALADKHAVIARSDQPTKAAPARFRRAADDAWVETAIPI